MPNLGTQSAESSGTGLTFVRPLPQIHAAPRQTSEKSSQKGSLGLTDRLFPPRAHDDSASLPPVTGLELGHFVVEERIGRGGMGAVFRAIDQRLDRVVALKILSPELSSDPEAVQRFQNEARAAARLDHDNIARVHYIGEEHGLHFIAFEFVVGTNVRNFILQKGKLSPADAVNYTLQIAEALRHTAAASVVHRDIKPSNIVVASTGRAKLVDLGLARHSPSDQALELTVAGTALGTFDYIAPEQAIDARNVDVRSDIYSLGCTLYHMLTGEPPYPRGTMFEKVMNHHRPIPPDVSVKNPRVSPQLSRVVQKMMASNPDERYATPENLIADLIQIAESLGLEPTTPDTVIWTTPLFHRRSSYWDGTRTWMAVALVLLLLVFLVDKLRWGDGGSRDPVLAGEPALPAETALPDPVQELPAATADPKPAAAMDEEPPPVSRQGSPPGAFLDGMRQALDLRREIDVPLAADDVPSPVVAARDSGSAGNGFSGSPPLSPPGDPVLDIEPFAIIPASGGGPRRRASTLAAACKIAENNEVIEIQVDGRLDVQQEALRISNKRIKIRPASRFRPVLRFDLSSQLSVQPFSRSAEMIEITKGGALELYDVDVEMDVDAESAVDQWAMISLSKESEFLAKGVSFTFINPGHLPATLFHLPHADSTGISSTLMPERMSAKSTQVQMTECLCRGEFDFAYVQNVNQTQFHLQNVALAISGIMFRIDGSNEIAMSMETEENPAVTLLLDHVTAVLGEGLVQATSGENGTLPRIDLNLHDSVFRVDQPNRPLVSVSGHEDYDVLLDQLNWLKNADPSFYQLTGPIGDLESSTSFVVDSRELTLEDCGVSEEQLVRENLLVLPSGYRLSAMHRVQPGDLFLRQAESGDFQNPALNAAGDGQDAGVDWSHPRFPSKLPNPSSDGRGRR